MRWERVCRFASYSCGALRLDSEDLQATILYELLFMAYISFFAILLLGPSVGSSGAAVNHTPPQQPAFGDFDRLRFIFCKIVLRSSGDFPFFLFFLFVWFGLFCCVPVSVTLAFHLRYLDS